VTLADGHDYSPPEETVLKIVALDDGLSLAGTLDLSTEAQARRAMERLLVRGARVTFDLSRLEFMDSTGLNLLVGALQTIGDEGRLTLRVSEGITDRVLGVSGLADRPNVTVRQV
jgi:anti-anti-sigma factor